MPAATVDNYIGRFPPDVQVILERLRETIHAAAPDATEAIKYDMPVFRLPNGYIFYVGAWKTHIGIYPIHPQAPDLEAEVAPFRSGKDTIKFKYRDPLPYALIARLVAARIETLAAKSRA